MTQDFRSDYNGDLATMLTQIIEHAPDAIVTVDEQHNIVMFNQAAEEVFGYAGDQVMGMPLRELIPIDDISEPEIHNGTPQTGDTYSLYGKRCCGELFPCEVTVSKTEYKGKKYCTAMVRDISDRIEKEKQIAEQANELQRYRIRKKAELRNEVHQLQTSTSIFR